MKVEPLSVIKVKNLVMCLSTSAVIFGWKTSQSLLDSTRKTSVSISNYMAQKMT